MAAVFAFLYFELVQCFAEQLGFLPGGGKEVLQMGWKVFHKTLGSMRGCRQNPLC